MKPRMSGVNDFNWLQNCSPLNGFTSLYWKRLSRRKILHSHDVNVSDPDIKITRLIIIVYNKSVPFLHLTETT
jgi:hypothetical protein